MKTFEFLKDRKTFKTAEAYKALRTNLLFCGSDIKVVVLTSCSPNDGKSYVTQRLAVNLAEDGKKVLMIDCDLRKSTTVGKIITYDEIFGLSHYLSGQAELEKILFCNKHVPNMYSIFAGSFPPNPAELLGSKKFKDLIEKMRKEFDYILIDTPPLGSVIDSAVVSQVCDGAIMVIRSAKTSYKFAREIKEQLEKSGCRILGAVLNAVDVEDRGKYYYKYYRDYYYNDYYKSK